MLKEAAVAIGTLSELYNKIHNIQKNSARSLPERAAEARAISRVYIDRELSGEEILLPLIGALNQLFVAYIITALGLESAISSTRTVGDVSSLVASESLTDDLETVKKYFGNVKASCENDMSVSTEQQKRGGGTTVVQLTPLEQSLITGRIIEMGITSADGADVPVRIMSQLIPRVLESEVLGTYVAQSVPSAAKRRFQQAMAGEIRFFRDFVLALDKLETLKESLKKDKTGELTDLLGQRTNKIAKWWLSIVGFVPNYNTASSVLILDKHTFEKHLADEEVRFDAKTQSKFFKDSFVLHLVVVDRDYNEVEIYTSGIKGSGEYSFQAIEKVGQKPDRGMDLKDIMTVFSRGANPRI